MSGIFPMKKVSFPIIIIMIILLSLAKGSVSLKKEPKLIAVKQLISIEKLFVILDTGLYLYEYDLSNFIKIYKFNLEQQKALREHENIKTIFSQFSLQEIEYYSCLIENILFIYNPINKHIYNLAIGLEQNMEPIFMNINYSNIDLYFIKENTLKMKLYSFSSDFKVKEEKENTIYKFKDSLFANCKMNNINYIKCFYYQSDFNTIDFYFNNNSYIIKEINKNISLFNNNKTFITITSDISYDNNLFICFLMNDYKYNCFFSDKINNNMNYVATAGEKYCKNIKVTYFKETNEFVAVCQQNDKYLLSIIKNSIFDINKNIYKTKVFPIYNNESYFSVIYNKFTKDYSIIGNFNFTIKNTLRHLSSNDNKENENHEKQIEPIFNDIYFSHKFSSNKPYINYNEKKGKELASSTNGELFTDDMDEESKLKPYDGSISNTNDNYKIYENKLLSYKVNTKEINNKEKPGKKNSYFVETDKVIKNKDKFLSYEEKSDEIFTDMTQINITSNKENTETLIEETEEKIYTNEIIQEITINKIEEETTENIYNVENINTTNIIAEITSTNKRSEKESTDLHIQDTKQESIEGKEDIEQSESTLSLVVSQKLTEEISSDGLAKISNDISSIEIIESFYLEDMKINNIILEHLFSLSKENFVKSLDQLMKENKIDSDYKTSGDNYALILKPLNSEKYKDKTNIIFENCEKILRQTNKIPDSSTLTLLQIEIKNNNNQSLVNQVEYRIYDENKNPLDISVCKDTDIIINYAINENVLSSLDQNLVSEFKDLGVNIFDIEDPFFNDLCTPFTYHDIDIILEDRYNIIYQNFSVCEEGCNYTNIDLEKKFISCQCKVKNEMNNNIIQSKFQENKDIVKYTNIDVMKCSSLVFRFDNKSNNIGFIIFCILVSVFLILVVVHVFKGIYSVSNFIYEEMKKYNYINNTNRKFFEENKANKDKDNKVIKSRVPRKRLSMVDNTSVRNIISNRRKTNVFNMNIGENFLNTSDKDVSMNVPNQNKNNNKSNPIKKIIIKKKKKGKGKGKGNTIINNGKEKIVKKEEEVIVKNVNKEKIDNFGIIKINIEKAKETYYPEESNKTLHNYTFRYVGRFESRNIFQILYIFLLTKQIVFHTIFEKSPLIPFQIYLGIFIFTLSFDLSINALFYSNSNISKRYNSQKGLISFTVSNNTMIIIISSIVSLIFIPIMIKFSKIDNDIRKIFSREEIRLKKDKNYTINDIQKRRIFTEVENALKYYKIKLILLLIFQFIFLLFSWYFVTSFCQVYQNTQINWLANFLSAVLIRFVIEIVICIISAKLYLISAHIDYVTFYKFMLFIYDFSC